MRKKRWIIEEYYQKLNFVKSYHFFLPLSNKNFIQIEYKEGVNCVVVKNENCGTFASISSMSQKRTLYAWRSYIDKKNAIGDF